MKKTELLALIAADEIESAFDLAAQSATVLTDAGLQEDLVLLRSQWEDADKDEMSGTIAPADLQLQRNKVKRALIALVKTLPEDLPVKPPPAPHKRGEDMEEGRFKWRLFFLMLTIKAWIIYWVLFHQATGGFTSGEALATIALLLPAFAAYTGPMLADLLRQRNQPTVLAQYQPKVSRNMRWFTIGFVLVYGLILHNVIGAKAAGRLADNPAANFENMTKWLAIVESGLGVYLGLIVGEFFRKGK